jgi:predicted metal-binding protein
MPEAGKYMTENGAEKFSFLTKLALEKGAVDAKIITTDRVVVENRVVLKCKVGCNHYGETLACPPYTPTAEEFRKIVSEYSYAMFMKFTTNAVADAELYKHLMTYQTDSTVPQDIKDKAAKFWQNWKENKLKTLQAVVDLEKAAMKQGHSLAISFISGHCQLCDKCSTQTGICKHPELARWSEDAVGVNVKKTAANAGIEFTFPFAMNADSFALLLIE